MPNRICGEYGHLKKDGQPCGMILPDGENACQHHSEDKTRQKKIIETSRKALMTAKVPRVETNDFKTIDDCLAVRAAVVRLLCKDNAVDFRRLDMILKACTGASGDHATKAVEKQNELLLALGGHGAGIAMLQRLREAPIRVLPGRRKALDVDTIVNAEVEESEDQQEHTA